MRRSPKDETDGWDERDGCKAWPFPDTEIVQSTQSDTGRYRNPGALGKNICTTARHDGQAQPENHPDQFGNQTAEGSEMERVCRVNNTFSDAYSVRDARADDAALDGIDKHGVGAFADKPCLPLALHNNRFAGFIGKRDSGEGKAGNASTL